MSKKYYVVWKGHKTGIFNTWSECKSQIDGFSGARFKSFSSKQEAELAYQNNPNITLVKSLTNLKKQKTKSSYSTLSQEQIEALPLDIKIFTDEFGFVHIKADNLKGYQLIGHHKIQWILKSY